MPTIPTETVPVLTVSALTFVLKEVVETSFPHVWVSGEISNLMRAGSGHVYFTLKDDAAQLKAVMWRSTAQRVRFDLRDGMEVITAGAIQVYEARGQHQLVVEQMQPKGIGPLELAFRQLQQKLAAEKDMLLMRKHLHEELKNNPAKRKKFFDDEISKLKL